MQAVLLPPVPAEGQQIGLAQSCETLETDIRPYERRCDLESLVDLPVFGDLSLYVDVKLLEGGLDHWVPVDHAPSTGHREDV